MAMATDRTKSKIDENSKILEQIMLVVCSLGSATFWITFFGSQPRQNAASKIDHQAENQKKPQLSKWQSLQN